MFRLTARGAAVLYQFRSFIHNYNRVMRICQVLEFTKWGSNEV